MTIQLPLLPGGGFDVQADYGTVLATYQTADEAEQYAAALAPALPCDECGGTGETTIIGRSVPAPCEECSYPPVIHAEPVAVDSAHDQDPWPDYPLSRDEFRRRMGIGRRLAQPTAPKFRGAGS